MNFILPEFIAKRQGSFHYSMWLSWVLLFFCAVLLIACGGAIGDDVDNVGWIRIDSPSSDPYTSFSSTGLEYVKGEAFISQSLKNIDNSDPGVEVTWENLTTAENGYSFQNYGWNCSILLFCVESHHEWFALIPLIEGDNVINVRAYDSLGNQGEDTITISYPFYHLPLILPIYWSALIPNYIPIVVYISSDKLWFEAKVDTGNLPADVRFDWDTSGNNFASSYESTLTQSLAAVPDVQSVFSADTGIAFGTSLSNNLDVRVVARNSEGEKLETTSMGSLLPFPVQTVGVGSIGPTEATVYGSYIGPAYARAHFEWSTDPNLAFWEVKATQVYNFNLKLEGLQENTTYYYRAMVKSYFPSIGFRGEIKSFSTSPII